MAKAFGPEDFDRMKQRVDTSYRSLESHRNSRLERLRSYVGSSYGDDSWAGKDETVVNLVELLVSIYMQQLASGQARVLVTTDKFQMKQSAAYFQMAMNHAAKKIELTKSLVTFILEGLFSMGVMKIGVTSEYDDHAAGFLHDVSMPFADPVFFDDFVYDTTVQRWEQIAFCGNHYRLSREDVEADPRNDEIAVSEIGTAGTQWDLMNGDRAEDLSGSNEGFDEDDDRETCHLWDIWVPRRERIFTFAANGGRRPLRVTRWEGPDNGPFRTLIFNTVLNNIQPLAPLATGMPLADLINCLWNKMGEQASRQKTVTFVQRSAERDGSRVVHANDGDTITVTNTQGISQARFGGVEQATLAMAGTAREMHSYVNGNMDISGGLSVGAPTLGQEQMMAGSSNQRIRSMQQKVVEAVSGVFSDLGWHLWNDPLVDMKLTGKISGTDEQFETRWPVQVDELGRESDLRKGQYNDLNFDIEPFSMQDQSPQTRLAALRGIYQQDIAPNMQLIAAQGGRFDFQAYLQKVGEYSNLPELADMVQMAPAPTSEEPATLDPGGGKPAVTTRQYDRVSSGGMSRGGFDRALGASLAGAGGESGGSSVTRG